VIARRCRPGGTSGCTSSAISGAVFDRVPARLAEHGLIEGERIGVDASTMAADAALRTIVRRDSGETWRRMLHRMAEESGITTPSADDLVRLDRARTGKKLSNDDWTSPVDPDARITRMKDGTTHLAHEPEHAVDLDTAAIVATEVPSPDPGGADRGDTATLPDTLTSAETRLKALGRAPSAEAPAELVADKGYHSRDVLKALDGGGWKSRSASKRRPDVCRRHGDHAARRAVHDNRARLLSGVAEVAFRRRAELCERSFALALDRGGMRRTWLRGSTNVHERYLLHVAGYNLGLIMRRLTGYGTPREAAAALHAAVGVAFLSDDALIVVVIAVGDDDAEAVALIALVGARR
jgi:hypothetical protein